MVCFYFSFQIEIMFLEGLFLKLLFCMTGLVLLAGGMVRQNEGSNIKLHRRSRKLSKVLKRSANVNLQQKKAVLVKKRAIVAAGLLLVAWMRR